jgi:formamidopyrimidine-DNA glycosylase
MPELPEVHTIAQDLDKLIRGKQVASATIRWERIITCPTPDEFRRRITGTTILGVARRGKYLVLQLSGGSCLLIHLRMTGQLLTTPPPNSDRKHVHLVLDFVDGTSLHYVDQRKFGRLYLVDDTGPILGCLGPEPLSDTFSAEELGRMLAERRRRIKPLLLDQHFLAGLGNIYVDEALHDAGIHPLRRANELSREEVKRLHGSIVAVLRCGIANRGTTLSDYRDARGEEGSNQEHLQVVRRQGQPCLQCGTPIERMKLEQRGTYFCPVCQPASNDDRGNGEDESTCSPDNRA